MTILKVVLFSGFYAVLNAFDATLIKNELLGIQLTSARQFFELLITPKVIMAFGMIFISALVMMKALSIHKFSLVIPIATGINFLITVGVGVLYFNDSLNVYQYSGILLILIGILVLSIVSA